jgi:antitoxin MazE
MMIQTEGAVMHSTVAKWGNCLTIRVPSPLAKELGLRVGSAIDMEVVDNKLVIRCAKPRYTLEELVAGMTAENMPDETFDVWPVGTELVEWDPK